MHEVRSTFRILGYQRPFIQGFAAIAKPLTNLTKKDAPFNWTPECRKALDSLIERVTSDPVLWHPDPNAPFELQVDASDFALRSILFQWDENGKH